MHLARRDSPQIASSYGFMVIKNRPRKGPTNGQYLGRKKRREINPGVLLSYM